MSEQQISKSSDWYDATIVDNKPLHLSGIIFFALFAVAIFAVVAYGAVDVGTLGLMALFVGGIAILWLSDSWLKGVFTFNTNLMQLPLLGLILIGVIQLLPLRSEHISSVLLSAAPAQTLSLAPYMTRFAVVQLVIYFVFFAAALTFISNQKRLRKAVLTIIIFGSLMAFFGILQRFANFDGIYGMRQPSGAISFASYVNQHHFAALMEMTIGLTLALLFGKALGKERQIFLIVAAAVMGMAILFTGSRGGLVSLLAVLVFIVAANLLKKEREKFFDDDEEKPTGYKHKLIYIAGGLAVILGLFGAVIMLGGDDSLLRGTNLGFDGQDVSNGRTHFWQVALKIISDYPLLGTGLDSFGISFTQYDTWNGTFRIEQAHNEYLQILADAGIFGLACIAVFIFLLFKKSLRIISTSSDSFRSNVSIGGLAGCLGILIHSLFDFPLRTPANGYIFLIFVVLATGTISYPKLYRRKK